MIGSIGSSLVLIGGFLLLCAVVVLYTAMLVFIHRMVVGYIIEKKYGLVVVFGAIYVLYTGAGIVAIGLVSM